MSALRQTRFEMDAYNESFSRPVPLEGYTIDDNWNGWACPMFTRTQAFRWLEVHQTVFGTDSAGYNEVADYFWVNMDPDVYDDRDSSSIERYNGIRNERSNWTMYHIGAYMWTWIESPKHIIRFEAEVTTDPVIAADWWSTGHNVWTNKMDDGTVCYMTMLQPSVAVTTSWSPIAAGYKSGYYNGVFFGYFLTVTEHMRDGLRWLTGHHITGITVDAPAHRWTLTPEGVWTIHHWTKDITVKAL